MLTTESVFLDILQSVSLVIQACIPSYPGGWSRRRECQFKANLGNSVKPLSQNNKVRRRLRKWLRDRTLVWLVWGFGFNVLHWEKNRTELVETQVNNLVFKIKYSKTIQLKGHSDWFDSYMLRNEDRKIQKSLLSLTRPISRAENFMCTVNMLQFTAWVLDFAPRRFRQCSLMFMDWLQAQGKAVRCVFRTKTAVKSCKATWVNTARNSSDSLHIQFWIWFWLLYI